jgi:hypothetical protein
MAAPLATWIGQHGHLYRLLRLISGEGPSSLA